jgi:4-O-beta-D-mannosyl-D-glucose phosphorylase
MISGKFADSSVGFDQRLDDLIREQESLLSRRNAPQSLHNGIFHRWEHPALTRDHVPLNWRYDLNSRSNPQLLERIGVNAVFNCGAIAWDGRYALMVRVDGSDRKSYFAVAESRTGVDGFRFWPKPVSMPEMDCLETNLYDMRLTAHEDGYIYGLFCAERRDPDLTDDSTAAIARCGIARTHNLVDWERLTDLDTSSSHQRNVVLHPEFIDGKYGLYTRPLSGFDAGNGDNGICWGLTSSMDNASLSDETPVDPRSYHTISELKNGLGPAPIKTRHGWLQLAHGVRRTAAGMRYVLYAFISDLNEPWRIVHKPAGYLLAPIGNERMGDVANVLFCNGWIRNSRDEVFIYYASADTRLHVATSTVDSLVDYCMHSPPDGMRTANSVDAVNRLIDANQSVTRSMLRNAGNS